MTYVPKVHNNGPDELVVESGGAITIESGGSITVAGVTVDENTLALNGLTASADELNLLDGAGTVVASGTAVTHQADLANDANGTAIASAVNGLRDALIAFGIMAAS